jgi:hypothetical protein
MNETFSHLIYAFLSQIACRWKSTGEAVYDSIYLSRVAVQEHIISPENPWIERVLGNAFPFLKGGFPQSR